MALRTWATVAALGMALAATPSTARADDVPPDEDPPVPVSVLPDDVLPLLVTSPTDSDWYYKVIYMLRLYFVSLGGDPTLLPPPPTSDTP